MGETRDWDRKT